MQLMLDALQTNDFRLIIKLHEMNGVSLNFTYKGILFLKTMLNLCLTFWRDPIFHRSLPPRRPSCGELYPKQRVKRTKLTRSDIT